VAAGQGFRDFLRSSFAMEDPASQPGSGGVCLGEVGLCPGNRTSRPALSERPALVTKLVRSPRLEGGDINGFRQPSDR